MSWMSLFGLDTKVARYRSRLSEVAIAAEDRWELAQLEWQQHKSALLRVVVLAVLLLCLGTVALVVLSAAAVVQWWDTPWRTTAAWGVAALWVLVWGVAWLRLHQHLRSLGSMFTLTRAELARDWQTLKEKPAEESAL